MKIHDLKTVDPYFDPAASGEKPFELRYNDRDYQVGDILRLRHYIPAVDNYSGKVVSKRVTYILHGGIINWLDTMQ